MVLMMKRGREGSVENVSLPENHDVVCQCHQTQFSAPTPMRPSFAVGALPSFDHGHDGFDLGSFSIGLTVESGLHKATVTSFGRLVRGASLFGWNDSS